jgi:endonuclease YncB( thermonuclease family)
MRCVHGRLVVLGKSPDGDSIRFLPHRPELLLGRRVRPSSDGSVVLRLEGIDAPESHYNTLSQPAADEARDALLELCGFGGVTRQGETVLAATPDRIDAAILTSGADPNGRPISMLLAGADPPAADGADVAVDEAVLTGTVNARLLAEGAVYPLVYANLPPALGTVLRELARGARERRAGVWDRDCTDGFDLVDGTSIGRGGQLILPKLFRRCSDWLAAGAPLGSLPAWLASHGPVRDDGVQLAGGQPTTLSTLLEQHGTRVALTADPVDLVYAG